MSNSDPDKPGVLPEQQVDILIAGGGPVGMALALALQEYDCSVLLLEARALPEVVDDPRPLALSYGSHLILRRLGVWEKLTQPTPILAVHITNRGHSGQTHLTPGDAGVPALGYVVNYHELYAALRSQVQQGQTDYQTGAQVASFQTDAQHARIRYQQNGIDKLASTALLVLADGGRLAEQVPGVKYQTHDYGQTAIIANLEVTSQQQGAAFEHFTLDGPLALLPSGQGYALVWTLPTDKAETILQLADQEFLSQLQNSFDNKLINFVAAGQRTSFPLILKHASNVTAERTVLIGNAAQTLHPVAGQGFNLGLRDAWELADEISHTSPGGANEAGSPHMLASYNKRRRIDREGGRLFTDSLVKLFTRNFPLLQTATGWGLAALDHLPPAKRFVARRMIFGARG
ncbi:MAG: FAD-dependent monooxygenase [Nitrosomonas sp.]|jgi:2-octaprenyl-6-methoxyphenol hydroxylase|nr:FAD-dependent monooxygenase [Nitrosomonas sp.]MCC7135121.1 FAD-dependent monooxygenase [Nitrosomonas sp.]